VKAVGSGCDLIEAINPSVFLKSRKTGDDLVNYRGAMEEDGAAMCRFYAWLEQALSTGTPVTEVTVHDRLTEERSRGKTFVELSFGTIAGFKGNGAMPHYQASASAHAKLDGDGLLLIDSGGQYLGGTTDVTRTWPIGRATDAMKRDYTLVLKGMIALSRQKFPRETLSTYLDSIARAPIWNAGLDYGHGTGHGVGYFLCVHEGPHTIRKAPGEPQMALHPGMVTSIEPALYRTGKWGIRTENLVVAVECATGEEAEFGSWLEFETLTLCPIDMSLIDESLMRADEIAWLDAYHQTVRERLAPHLQGEALSWLVRRTQPFSAVDFAEAG
jgi:Xaa-Pro aminopeptidase